MPAKIIILVGSFSFLLLALVLILLSQKIDDKEIAKELYCVKDVECAPGTMDSNQGYLHVLAIRAWQ
jgi:hypothetical protein